MFQAIPPNASTRSRSSSGRKPVLVNSSGRSPIADLANTLTGLRRRRSSSGARQTASSRRLMLRSLLDESPTPGSSSSTTPATCHTSNIPRLLRRPCAPSLAAESQQHSRASYLDGTAATRAGLTHPPESGAVGKEAGDVHRISSVGGSDAARRGERPMDPLQRYRAYDLHPRLGGRHLRSHHHAARHADPH